MEKDLLVFALLALAVVTFFSIIWRVGAALSRKALANMQRLADRLNLQVLDQPTKLGIHPYPEARGTIRGKAVRIYNYTTGSGKSKTTWAAMTVTPGVHGGLTFALTREGFGSKVMSLFGAKEVKVGNAEFDDRWFVRSNAPEFFAAALLPEIQVKINRLSGTWKLENGAVTYTERGLFTDLARCERFASAVEPACDLADIAEVYSRQQS
ncbi:MAG: hypothetical protein H7A44_01295 [Opitutaceae bacterium]|nr:hypothetical protein [Cephaloticoccus sp.]MCP5529048.1 hypothetical protein [Opitutaceae bacterium]